MQTGKKKLILDHLIVQKMDDEDSAGDDVQSILTFGAKALFDDGDQGAHDIICVCCQCAFAHYLIRLSLQIQTMI